MIPKGNCVFTQFSPINVLFFSELKLSKATHLQSQTHQDRNLCVVDYIVGKPKCLPRTVYEHNKTNTCLSFYKSAFFFLSLVTSLTHKRSRQNGIWQSSIPAINRGTTIDKVSVSDCCIKQCHHSYLTGILFLLSPSFQQ